MTSRTEDLKRQRLQAERQKELARSIGIALHDSPKLIPLGRHSSFGLQISRPGRGMGSWIEEKAGHLAFQAIALQLHRQAGTSHVIDHAWLAGSEYEPHEPWVLVSEPYISTEKAEQIKAWFDQNLADEWYLVCETMPPARSSWNPGNCTPLVFTFAPGLAEYFVKHALTWWLNHDDEARD